MQTVLADCHRLIRENFDARMSKLGIPVTYGDFRFLVAIATASGDRQLDLAAVLYVDKATVNDFVNRLRGKQLILDAQGINRRCRPPQLTEKGELALKQALEENARLEVEMAADIQAARLGSIVGALRDMKSNLVPKPFYDLCSTS
jgi:DNA-binding MarR family transcriptional regulator